MIEEENIRMFLTSEGAIIGEYIPSENDALVKLKNPFRVIPGHDGKVTVASLFIKETWCVISPLSCMEISVVDGMKQMYTEYSAQVHSSIITPTKGKIIL